MGRHWDGLHGRQRPPRLEQHRAMDCLGRHHCAGCLHRSAAGLRRLGFPKSREQLVSGEAEDHAQPIPWILSLLCPAHLPTLIRTPRSGQMSVREAFGAIGFQRRRRESGAVGNSIQHLADGVHA